jgi:hypothetical protein
LFFPTFPAQWGFVCIWWCLPQILQTEIHWLLCWFF